MKASGRGAILAALGLAAAALAQDAGRFEGRWRGSYDDRNGRSRSAELVISGRGGTWIYERDTGKWGSPCLGPELPVVVLSASPEELQLRIDGEKVLKGCGERRVTLKPAADGTLAGTFEDNGHAVKLKRP